MGSYQGQSPGKCEILEVSLCRVLSFRLATILAPICTVVLFLLSCANISYR